MRYNKMVVSSIMLILLNTGCVKPTDSQKVSGAATIYNEQAGSVVYENGQPIYESTGTATNTPQSVYSSGEDSTVITPIEIDGAQTPADPYQQPASSGGGGAYSTTKVATNSAYDDPYSATLPSNTGGFEPIDDPYGSDAPSSYSTNLPYGSGGGSSSSGKGIQLQVAALKDYYAAEEFKKNLSLDPRYSAYIKRGKINKVIVTGIPTRAEAKALAARQFPGAFIVGGYETSSSSSSGSSYSAPATTGGGDTSSGIGIQVGAFSSKEKARIFAQEKAGGEYTAVVKTATSNGRTIYKAIILGFSSRADAKSAISSGRFKGYVVSGIHP